MRRNQSFIWVIIALLFHHFSYSKNGDTLSYSEKINSGDYYPFIKLDKDDKIKLPIEFELELVVDELRDVDIKHVNFYSALNFGFYSYLDTLIKTKNNSSLYFNDPNEFVRLIYPENDKKYFRGWEYDGPFYDSTKLDSFNFWHNYVESEFPVKWNLRNYPFDKQKLSFIFESREDTSFIRLSESKLFPPKIKKDKFIFLKDGFTITNFTTEKKYIENPYFAEYADGERNQIAEQLIFNIEINRSGSFLFFKLFFGGYLSFLISYLVLFIERKRFHSRITLSLGGVFGAIGNKYFVENSMPSIQVLTKADIINNLTVLFIVLNIFIVIAQNSKNIKIWKFENNYFSAIVTIILFLILNFIAIVY